MYQAVGMAALMIQAALTERPVHVPMHERDVMIRFDADGDSKEGG
jgi:hypothetical protein